MKTYPQDKKLDQIAPAGRIGSPRAFFKYLVPRSEAYDKKYKEKLREDDK